MHMDLDTNMKMVGKRYPYYASYKVRSQGRPVVEQVAVGLLLSAGGLYQGGYAECSRGHIV